MCVRGIPSSADRAFPSCRPELNIKAQTGLMCLSVQETQTGLDALEGTKTKRAV